MCAPVVKRHARCCYAFAMRGLTRGGRRVLGALMVATAATLACSGQGVGEGPGGGQTHPGDTGTVGLHLQIGNGVSLQLLSFTISGTGLPSYAGSVPIGDAQSIEFEIGGIQAGGPYTIAFSGTDTQGDPCTGSATFNIVVGATTSATVTIICTQPPDASLAANVTTGTLAIDAGVTLTPAAAYQCPGISSFSINPAEILAPQTAALQVATIEGSGGSPGTPTLVWTTTAGTFVDTSSTTSNLAAPTFRCGGFIGTAIVTVTVGLTGSNNGVDAGNVCAGAPYDTASGNIVCEPQCVSAANCSSPQPTCAAPTCNAGLCGFNFAPVGTACGGPGDICNGSTSCVAPSFDVVRVGNGSALTSGETAPVFIDNYSITGTLQSSIALPTTVNGANQPLTLISTDTTEGDLNTSSDGRWLVMTGHADAVGTTPVTGNGVGAFINAADTINTSTPLTGAFVTAGILRSAVSLDGNELWASGFSTDTPNTGGVWFFGAADAQLVAGTKTIGGRDLRIAGGQLYGESSQPNFGTIGTGTPESGTQTLTTLQGLPAAVTKSGASPWGFVFFDLIPAVPGVDTLYVADDRSSGGGGVTKFVASLTDAGTLSWTPMWNQMGTAGDGGAVGFRGLAGYATGSTVTLMATTGEAMDANDQLAVIVDTGSPTPTLTMLATSSTNEVFRGVAIPPHP
jgi:hypothetical protein